MNIDIKLDSPATSVIGTAPAKRQPNLMLPMALFGAFSLLVLIGGLGKIGWHLAHQPPPPRVVAIASLPTIEEVSLKAFEEPKENANPSKTPPAGNNSNTGTKAPDSTTKKGGTVSDPLKQPTDTKFQLPPPVTTDTTPKPPAPASQTPTVEQPFLGFPKEISLPAIDSKSPMRFGAANKDFEYVFKLVGGNAASGGRYTVSISKAKNSTKDHAWEIFAREQGKPANGKLADLFFKDNAIHFQWTDTAVTGPATTALRNCLLLTTVGTESNVTQLRKKASLPKVMLAYEKKTYNLPVDSIPDPKDIVIELDPFTINGAPKPRFPAPGKAKFTNKDQSFTADFAAKELYFVKIQIDAKCEQDGLEIVVTPQLQFDPEGKPMPLTEANLKKLEDGEAMRLQQAVQRQLDNLPKPDPKDKKNEGVAAQRTALNRQLSELKNIGALIEKLRKHKTDFAEGGAFKVRVFTQVDKQTLELAASK